MGKRKRQAELRPAARLDLIEIACFLAVESGSGYLADRFLSAAATAVDRLVRMPRLGAPRPRFGSIRLWRIPEFPNYLVVYAETNQGIDVLRVLHARRNLEALLDDMP